MKQELSDAKRLYRDFRDSEPRRARRISVDIPRVAAIMGRVRAIEYDTTHAGKVHLYQHTFRAGSRPYLIAGTRRNQLLMVCGRFHVTARGIVDLDARGREVER